jgi:hypothetical protein
MVYHKLKQEIREIADISASVPEAFRQKCFEILLTHLVSSELHPEPPKEVKPIGEPEKKNLGKTPTTIPITTSLRVFMGRTQITEEELNKLVLFADGDVHFLREPAKKNISDGQISWALLVALKNCILKDSLTVDPEAVRSVCQDKGFYDTANFASTFKRPKFAKLFKGKLEQQGNPRALTPGGEKALAELIKALTVHETGNSPKT